MTGLVLLQHPARVRGQCLVAETVIGGREQRHRVVLVFALRIGLEQIGRALRGGDLSRLREAVEQEFLALDAEELATRAAMARLETGFVQRFASLRDRSP